MADKKNLLIFSNCHGNHYKTIFEKHTNIPVLYTIQYIISYENLHNFNNIRHQFENADVLIINPIENYSDYTFDNLKKYLKPECIIIRLPYVRFSGFWLEEKYLTLQKFKTDTVIDFPDVSLSGIDAYIKNFQLDKEVFETHFAKCILKIKVIESNADIPFVDFFIENYKKYPLFRDEHHPTMCLLNHIADKLIAKMNDIQPIDSNFIPNFIVTKERGHFKPIPDAIKNISGLEYDLDSFYVVTRHDFIKKILEYDSNAINSNITNYDEFYSKVFNM